MCFLFTNFLRNVVSDLIPGHMKPLGHHRKPLGGVTIFDDFPSPKEFYEDYVSKSQPLINHHMFSINVKQKSDLEHTMCI
jgi:hypothetical protein